MTKRPILFSGPMVRALLEGSKTQTRRVVKKSECWPISTVRAVMLETRGTVMAVDAQRCTYAPEIKCPYGQTGDQLWVREAWQLAGGNTGYWYRATDDKADNGESPVSRWKPSIHMPRAASRISLEITSVRVERLQDISEADAQAEGAHKMAMVGSCDPVFGHPPFPQGHARGTFRFGYQVLWESINGPGSWDLNPWVWVVEFEVVKP